MIFNGFEHEKTLKHFQRLNYKFTNKQSLIRWSDFDSKVLINVVNIKVDLSFCLRKFFVYSWLAKFHNFIHTRRYSIKVSMRSQLKLASAIIMSCDLSTDKAPWIFFSRMNSATSRLRLSNAVCKAIYFAFSKVVAWVSRVWLNL